ncbi:MAG TPA: hypothetical protein VGR02_07995 [Thermoanaerobaculia bacterium]|jgi:hypothetical protein|nr:hypothetical protein [Thermoanaerobaculia bacterium]
MTAAAEQSNFPTMIIPRGTEIRVNAHGQLSIKTPGNLVIQNSGNYSELESTNGSIRIEENVNVEAVSVRAAQACFVQGSLTAWKVHARRVALEDKARAYIMLLESEQLEIARTARLVGNFANEKELFLMMGKFTSQLKELPGSVEMGHQTPLDGRALAAAPTTPTAHPPATSATTAAHKVDDGVQLRVAQTLLERELARTDFPPREAEALRELLYAVREQNMQRIALIYRDAFAEIRTPSDALRQAYDHLDQFMTQRQPS